MNPERELIYPLPIDDLLQHPVITQIERARSPYDLQGLSTEMIESFRRNQMEPWRSIRDFMNEVGAHLSVEIPTRGIGVVDQELQRIEESLARHICLEYLTTSENEGVQTPYGSLILRKGGVFIAYRYAKEGRHVSFNRLEDRAVSTIDEAKEAYRTPGLLESSLRVRMLFQPGEEPVPYSIDLTVLPYVARHVLGRHPETDRRS